MADVTRKFLTRAEAAQYCTERGAPVAKNTLQKFATVGGGPIYRRFGSRALYLESDLDTWISDKMSEPLRSTSEAV